MLTVLKVSDELSEKAILVNGGFHAIGQAIIAVAISLGYSVYTTVENKEQCALLQDKFPLVRTSNFHHK